MREVSQTDDDSIVAPRSPSTVVYSSFDHPFVHYYWSVLEQNRDASVTATVGARLYVFIKYAKRSPRRRWSLVTVGAFVGHYRSSQANNYPAHRPMREEVGGGGRGGGEQRRRMRSIIDDSNLCGYPILLN